MDSLNGLVKIIVESWANDYEKEFRLSENLPKIYNFTDYLEIGKGITELVCEILQHGRGDKLRLTTSLEGGIQILELAWNGKSLDEDTLIKINQNYADGKRSESLPERSGTKRAGFFLKNYGEIMIENYKDGLYAVRNIVNLPTQYR